MLFGGVFVLGRSVYRSSHRAGVDELGKENYWSDSWTCYDRIAACEMVITMPACPEIMRAIHSITRILFETSEQHKALRPSRIERDYTNAIKILKFLIEKNPFYDWTHLINFKTGEVAGDAVNLVM